MFDTMTSTKILGGFCGAFLVFLLGGFFAEFIYHEPVSHDGEHHQAYTIDTGDDAHGGEVEAEVPFEEVLASADASAGEKLFRKCAACHKAGQGENGTGPYLYGVVGRQVGAAEGFGSYSGNLSKVADVWTPENLNLFLANPKKFAPGTTMNFGGFSDIEDRADIIAWLDALDG